MIHIWWYFRNVFLSPNCLGSSQQTTHDQSSAKQITSHKGHVSCGESCLRTNCLSTRQIGPIWVLSGAYPQFHKLFRGPLPPTLLFHTNSLQVCPQTPSGLAIEFHHTHFHKLYIFPHKPLQTEFHKLYFSTQTFQVYPLDETQFHKLFRFSPLRESQFHKLFTNSLLLSGVDKLFRFALLYWDSAFFNNGLISISTCRNSVRDEYGLDW